MVAKYASSTILKSVRAKDGRNVMLAVVDATTAWRRLPGYPASHVVQRFEQLAKQTTYGPNTTKVAMK